MDINIHMCGYNTDIRISVYICVAITHIWLSIYMCGYNTEIWISIYICVVMTVVITQLYGYQYTYVCL